MSRRLLVLGWHNIDPTPFYPAAPDAGRRGFDRQLAAIDRLATVVPLSEAVDTLAAGGSLPRRAVALTFDDGYADWLDAAVPALDRRGMHGTFFLVSDILSGRVGAWWEELADAFDRCTATSLDWAGRTHDLSTPVARRAAQDALKDELKLVDGATRNEAVTRIAERIAPPLSSQPPRDPLFLDWDGARALAATGHGVGSHTVTHPILAREDAATQRHELAASREALEEGLGQTVDLLAYPNGNAGDYDQQTMELARAAGYRAAVTTRPGLVGPQEPPFAMHRVVLTPLTDVGELFGKVARKGTGMARKVANRAVRTLTPTG
ncbi:polysaccharide deacetylase family protein [Actinomycetospora cinnamomea]|uniref:Peptidoglycan/xylan/chitin deacetylase (PgdA/CDA1 family) n=1 Tax=Actinomycetospora cinnamomea TaxID=663609 RepID=A0A2U1F757_9PSEU|nr:polysaccharide deacetylase family protein [Actinomycetospora cinnamomea]PVZ08004.1 peptidoglycan/xylan/chitin deacetylase (PgdA/CDA1 family) [Actinomycetospora cinnamomea]